MQRSGNMRSRPGPSGMPGPNYNRSYNNYPSNNFNNTFNSMSNNGSGNSNYNHYGSDLSGGNGNWTPFGQESVKKIIWKIEFLDWSFFILVISKIIFLGRWDVEIWTGRVVPMHHTMVEAVWIEDVVAVLVVIQAHRGPRGLDATVRFL